MFGANTKQWNANGPWNAFGLWNTNEGWNDRIFGSDLVTNGSFLSTDTSEGSELVTDGDFSDTSEANSYTSDFSADADGFIVIRGTVDGNIDGIGGQDNNCRLTLDATDGGHYMRKLGQVIVGKTYRLRYSYYIPNGQSNVDGINAFNGTNWLHTTGTTTGSWTNIDIYFRAAGTEIRFQAYDGVLYSFQDAGGDDVFYIRNVIIDACTFTHHNDTADGLGPGASSGSLTEKASIDGSQSADSKLYQDASTSEGALYKHVITISGHSAGNCAPLVGGTEGTDRSTDATHTEYIVAGSSAEDGCVFDSNGDMEVDDVSLKQVTIDSWTSGTGWNQAVSSGALADGAQASAGTASDLEQDVGAVKNAKYELVITTAGATAGTMTPQIGGTNGMVIGTENKTFQMEIITVTDGNLKLQKDASWDGKITSIQVRRMY